MESLSSLSADEEDDDNLESLCEPDFCWEDCWLDEDEEDDELLLFFVCCCCCGGGG